MSAGGDRDRVWLRVRAILGEWGWAIALVAVVVAGVGGYATYTAYVDPGTTVEERPVSNWEGNGSYTTAATVTEPNPLYPEGTELSDRPAYFVAASPRLDGAFAFEYRASDGGTVDVTVEQTLVIRSVARDGESAVEYWRIVEPLGTTTAEGVGSDEPVRSTFSQNVSRVVGRAESVNERLGGAPGETVISVVSAVELDGEINGRSVERATTYRLPVEANGVTYAPGAVQGESVSGSASERVVQQRTYGPPWRIGGPVALVISVIGLVGLGYGRYGGLLSISAGERERLAFRSAREEFDDWITTARLPPSVLGRPRVDIDSLSGLVDTAIDVDARVFEAADGSAFYLPHDDLLYVYTPPEAPAVASGGDDRTDGSPDGEGVGDDEPAES